MATSIDRRFAKIQSIGNREIRSKRWYSDHVTGQLIPHVKRRTRRARRRYERKLVRRELDRAVMRRAFEREKAAWLSWADGDEQSEAYALHALDMAFRDDTLFV